MGRLFLQELILKANIDSSLLEFDDFCSENNNEEKLTFISDVKNTKNNMNWKTNDLCNIGKINVKKDLLMGFIDKKILCDSKYNLLCYRSKIFYISKKINKRNIYTFINRFK